MKWLIELETDDDLIVVCRLMNIFRRKGTAITTMALARRDTTRQMIVVLEAQSGIDHIYHFLRRTEGVHRVTAYRHGFSDKATFVFIEEEAGPKGLDRLRELFPNFKLIFASHGKFLLELPPGERWPIESPSPEMGEWLAFAPRGDPSSPALPG